MDSFTIVNEDSDNNIGKKVLDKGFVRLVDSMPAALVDNSFESAIVQMARVSYGSGTKSFREDLGLIKYLLENDHTSPFEGVVLKFHIKMPILVARQWVRHRTASLNEYSARYSVMEDEFYIPEPERLTKQSQDNKQGSSSISIDNPAEKVSDITKFSEDSYALYQTLLKSGLSRELSRMVLPVNIYTEMYWVMNLHNLLKFLRLRMDEHAQYEIRVYADAIYEIMHQIAPNIMSIWKSASMESIKLTGEEISIISNCISADLIKIEELAKEKGYSKRRIDNLILKIKNISNL